MLNHTRRELVRTDRTRAIQQQRVELQAAADTHSSLAFRAIKRAPPPPLEQIIHTGTPTTFPGHAVAHYGQVWAEWWVAAQSPPSSYSYQEISDALPLLTITQLREAALRFSGKTSAPDGRPPRDLAALSDRCLAALCDSYALWGRTHWP
jgi:hypothetical protein